MTSTAPCHCGSTLLWTQCCQPFLTGQAKARTAEQLMRSRFSAFCTSNIDYLIASHHPSKHSVNDRQELSETIAHCKWLRLQILATEKGSEEDNSGAVEFLATYKQGGKLSQLRERSRFVKERGEWLYLDGEVTVLDAATNTGRNDLCPCGSGKKFKKCCG